MNIFLSRLNGEPIGVSVIGIFVIDKKTILTVRFTVRLVVGYMSSVHVLIFYEHNNCKPFIRALN